MMIVYLVNLISISMMQSIKGLGLKMPYITILTVDHIYICVNSVIPFNGFHHMVVIFNDHL